jgi:hypothetical protein
LALLGVLHFWESHCQTDANANSIFCTVEFNFLRVLALVAISLLVGEYLTAVTVRYKLRGRFWFLILIILVHLFFYGSAGILVYRGELDKKIFLKVWLTSMSVLPLSALFQLCVGVPYRYWEVKHRRTVHPHGDEDCNSQENPDTKETEMLASPKDDKSDSQNQLVPKKRVYRRTNTAGEEEIMIKQYKA